MELVVNLLVLLGVVYLAVGFIFGLFFAFVGVKKMDPGAVEGTLGFKFIILPGTAIFWPLLLKRYLKRAQMPTEESAHRRASQS